MSSLRAVVDAAAAHSLSLSLFGVFTYTLFAAIALFILVSVRARIMGGCNALPTTIRASALAFRFDSTFIDVSVLLY